MKKKIKVLIIEDSAVTRKFLTALLSTNKDIEVVGTAMDPYIARDKIKRLDPDVLTLDVDMPKMDGITFLRNLMRLRPMPVVMVSSLTTKSAAIALEALRLGAVDYINKPEIYNKQDVISYTENIVKKVKIAAVAKIRSDDIATIQDNESKITNKTKHTRLTGLSTDKIIAIGASTGGTEAIKEILELMPADSPAIVITQHIPKAFSAAFAARVNNSSAMHVCEAVDGQKILQGHVYIAPGDQHLKLVRKDGQYFCQLDDGELVNRHKPSVDVMFESVANVVGKKALGVILTGMGADGARSLKLMRDMGAATIAQDEKSSTIWGMPGEAVKLDAVDYTLPLNTIADKLVKLTG